MPDSGRGIGSVTSMDMSLLATIDGEIHDIEVPGQQSTMHYAGNPCRGDGRKIQL